jgi:hypothetical protein
VIFWKVKYGVVIAAVTLLALFGGCSDLYRGFYW